MLSSLRPLFFLAFLSADLFAGNEGYHISITVKGMKEGTNCILANYYGGGTYKQDSVLSSAKGEIVFKGDIPHPQGMYMLISGNRRYFDFVIDADQDFSLQTDTADYINHMKVSGSKENAFLYEYLTFSQKKRKIAEALQEEYKKVKDNPEEAKKVTDKISLVEKETKNYMLDFIKTNPEAFLSKLFQLIREPEVPEIPTLANGQKDSTFIPRYFKAHYFDYFDFSDGRLLYTPVFHSKIKYYLDKLTIQEIDPPDSLNASVDLIAEKAKANPDLFKYLLNWMTYTYESSKVMGHEAVFVHLVDKYHSKGQTPWIDSTQLYKVVDKAKNLKFSLIGSKAYPINMKDTSGTAVSLYNIRSKYTILAFWDYDCGHCKKEIPLLEKLYNEKLKAKGVEVFAIESEAPAKGWNKFVHDHHLNWINAGDTDDYNRAVVKKAYDIYSTPVIYVLDETKTIKAKRLGIDQLDGYIDHLEKQKKMLNEQK